MANPARKFWLSSGTLVILFVAGFLYLSSDIGESIESQCRVNGFGQGSCSFTNTGWTPGTMCVQVQLINTRNESASSGTVCSGRVWPNDTVSRDVAIILPEGHCEGQFDANWKDICSINVVSVNSQLFQSQAFVPSDVTPHTEIPPHTAAASTPPPAGNELPYLFEQLEKPDYLATFEALFSDETDIEPWLAKYISDRDGVDSAGTERYIQGTVYETYSVCQPHNCPGNTLYVIFEPGGLHAWALVTKDDHSSRLFGRPNAEIQDALQSLQKYEQSGK